MNFKSLSAVFALTLASATFAHATPVTGTISINGSDTYTSNSITFNGNGNVGGTPDTTTSLGQFTACTGCVTFPTNPFIFTGAGTSVPGIIFTVTEGSLVSNLNLTNITGIQNDAFGLHVMGTGTFTETGYDSTAGSIILNSQTTGGMGVTFAASAAAAAPTPEPSSLMLLGTGVLGAAGMVRRRLTKVTA